MIKFYPEIIQGTEEWMALRCGMLTASEMHLIVHIPKPETRIKKNGEPYKQREWTPTETEADRAHLFALLAQRITGYVEPCYIGDDMLRGMNDELEARVLYATTYAPVQEVGFVTNDKWGFTIGYSPDGLVGDDGQLECKSRNQRLQVRTLTEFSPTNEIDPDFIIQVQTGLMVSERKWCDLVSYCGGLPMTTVRVFPDDKIQAAIVESATAFEARIEEKMAAFDAFIASKARLIPTERKIEQEMI